MDKQTTALSALPPFRVREAQSLADVGIVRLRKLEYEDVILKHPPAALRYLDEDDGEVILVGSAAELDERLQESAECVERYNTCTDTHSNSVQSKQVHTFDISDDTGSLEIWQCLAKRTREEGDNARHLFFGSRAGPPLLTSSSTSLHQPTGICSESLPSPDTHLDSTGELSLGNRCLRRQAPSSNPTTTSDPMVIMSSTTKAQDPQIVKDYDESSKASADRLPAAASPRAHHNTKAERTHELGPELLGSRVTTDAPFRKQSFDDPRCRLSRNYSGADVTSQSDVRSALMQVRLKDLMSQKLDSTHQQVRDICTFGTSPGSASVTSFDRGDRSPAELLSTSLQTLLQGFAQLGLAFKLTSLELQQQLDRVQRDVPIDMENVFRACLTVIESLRTTTARDNGELTRQQVADSLVVQSDLIPLAEPLSHSYGNERTGTQISTSIDDTKILNDRVDLSIEEMRLALLNRGWLPLSKVYTRADILEDFLATFRNVDAQLRETNSCLTQASAFKSTTRSIIAGTEYPTIGLHPYSWHTERPAEHRDTNSPILVEAVADRPLLSTSVSGAVEVGDNRCPEYWTSSINEDGPQCDNKSSRLPKSHSRESEVLTCDAADSLLLSRGSQDSSAPKYWKNVASERMSRSQEFSVVHKSRQLHTTNDCPKSSPGFAPVYAERRQIIDNRSPEFYSTAKSATNLPLHDKGPSRSTISHGAPLMTSPTTTDTRCILRTASRQVRPMRSASIYEPVSTNRLSSRGNQGMDSSRETNHGSMFASCPPSHLPSIRNPFDEGQIFLGESQDVYVSDVDICRRRLIDMGVEANKAEIVAEAVSGHLESALDAIHEDEDARRQVKGKSTRIAMMPGTFDDELYG